VCVCVRERERERERESVCVCVCVCVVLARVHIQCCVCVIVIKYSNGTITVLHNDYTHTALDVCVRGRGGDMDGCLCVSVIYTLQQANMGAEQKGGGGGKRGTRICPCQPYF
jgi:hypothetical protein